MSFLNKEIVQKIIEELEFSNITINCSECDVIENEQYTCTNCWAQGGHSPISMQTFLEDSFTFKYNPEKSNYDLDTLKTFKSFYQDFDTAYLYHDEYKGIIPDDIFDVPMGYKTIQLEEVLDFLID